MNNRWPITLDNEVIDAIIASGTTELTIDLPAQTLNYGENTVEFDIDSVSKELVKGLMLSVKPFR